MEPERFDDVAYRMLESPEPPRRPPRRRRWALAGAACLLATGALAAGASALGGGEDEQARESAPPKPRTNVTYTDRGTPFARDGRDCEARKRDGHRGKRSSPARD